MTFDVRELDLHPIHGTSSNVAAVVYSTSAHRPRFRSSPLLCRRILFFRMKSCCAIVAAWFFLRRFFSFAAASAAAAAAASAACAAAVARALHPDSWIAAANPPRTFPTLDARRNPRFPTFGCVPSTFSPDRPSIAKLEARGSRRTAPLRRPTACIARSSSSSPSGMVRFNNAASRSTRLFFRCVAADRFLRRLRRVVSVLCPRCPPFFTEESRSRTRARARRALSRRAFHTRADASSSVSPSRRCLLRDVTVRPTRRCRRWRREACTSPFPCCA